MIGKLLEKLTGYLGQHLDVLKLSIIERIAIVMGFCMFMMVGMMAATAIIIFVGIGLSIYLGNTIGSQSGGYFIVTGIYILLIGIVAIFKKQLLSQFAGLFVRLLTSNDDEEEDVNRKV